MEVQSSAPIHSEPLNWTARDRAVAVGSPRMGTQRQQQQPIGRHRCIYTCIIMPLVRAFCVGAAAGSLDLALSERTASIRQSTRIGSKQKAAIHRSFGNHIDFRQFSAHFNWFLQHRKCVLCMCHVRFDLISRILPCAMRAAIGCYHFGWLGTIITTHGFIGFPCVELRFEEISHVSSTSGMEAKCNPLHRYLCYLRSVKAVIYASNLVHG